MASATTASGQNDVLEETKPVSKKTLKLVTWNIDGLDPKNGYERTIAVCEKVREIKPDVLFFQEVIPMSWDTLTSYLSEYQHFCQSNTLPYFHTIAVHKDRLEVVGDVAITDFPNSQMLRHLLHCQVKFHGLQLHLFSSHLESTSKEGPERKRQLHEAFNQMATLRSEGEISIFGGDLNLRDKEVKAVGIPDRAVDLWEACGSSKEYEYTWDISTNDNLTWEFPNKPRMRFDRLYLCPADDQKIKPQKFSLIGTDRVISIGRFPSDHYGIYTEFICQPGK
ncbi:tyrosyl-DNA phosphodiesterase 2-like [Dysidea avara]|uniref:tyrosyl-DNA phosphodiesterase 2-like n=1 Tax=Dysidea avara TaxID=196820 RepID=UPI00332946AE